MVYSHDIKYFICQWEYYLSFDTHRHGPNSTLAMLLSRSGPFASANVTLSGMAAVGNMGDYKNWTGSVLGQANTFGFGRLAWTPTQSSEVGIQVYYGRVFDIMIPTANTAN